MMFYFLAVSLDGIICNEEGSPVGNLEIKCPYPQKTQNIIIDTCKKSSFPCETDGDSVHLKTNHNYVQGQLAILNLTWCEFVEWTE